MDIEKIKERVAKNVQERASLELEMIKHRRAEKEAIESDKRRAEVKLQAQIDHDAHILKRNKDQQIENEAKTPEAKTRKAFNYAKMIDDREIKAGLTKEQRVYKHMSEKDRRDCDNAIAQGDAKDVRDFLKKKRQKQEASKRNRRKLKGI